MGGAKPFWISKLAPTERQLRWTAFLGKLRKRVPDEGLLGLITNDGAGRMAPRIAEA